MWWSVPEKFELRPACSLEIASNPCSATVSGIFTEALRSQRLCELLYTLLDCLFIKSGVSKQ